jgi:hypothetical protein
MPAMKKLTIAFNPTLDWPAIEILKEMTGMVRHCDDDVRFERPSEVKRVDRLSLADQELAVI